MATFHIDEPREIGKKKDRLTSREKNMINLMTSEAVNEACWVGFKQVGMKDKGGRKVPNCVKEDYWKYFMRKMEKGTDTL